MPFASSPAGTGVTVLRDPAVNMCKHVFMVLPRNDGAALLAIRVRDCGPRVPVTVRRCIHETRQLPSNQAPLSRVSFPTVGECTNHTINGAVFCRPLFRQNGDNSTALPNSVTHLSRPQNRDMPGRRRELRFTSNRFRTLTRGPAKSPWQRTIVGPACNRSETHSRRNRMMFEFLAKFAWLLGELTGPCSGDFDDCCAKGSISKNRERMQLQLISWPILKPRE